MPKLATSISSQAQFNWFKRHLEYLVTSGKDKVPGIGYTQDQIREMLEAAEYDTLPRYAGPPKSCACGCGRTFPRDGTARRFAPDCTTKRRTKARSKGLERTWMAEIPMWITVDPALDYYETRTFKPGWREAHEAGGVGASSTSPGRGRAGVRFVSTSLMKPIHPATGRHRRLEVGEEGAGRPVECAGAVRLFPPLAVFPAWCVCATMGPVGQRCATCAIPSPDRRQPLREHLHDIGDRCVQRGIKCERALTTPTAWHIA
jgi:hypothetical protein